ncbi:MAG: hypothetical protein JWM87_2136 [Candidatus Eremiobacteraeota bacterium]|nr:hypothetical protein [Candidatus Eremiobacteraeota bacterium]
MPGSSHVRFLVPLLLAAALSGCSGAGRALPPAPSEARSTLGIPPAPPSMQTPRRPDFVNTVPKDPSSAALSAGTPVAHTPHPSFFNGEVALSNGVYYLQLPNGNIFGYYSYLPDSNFIYHFDLGYEYLIDANDGRGGMYMYDFASGHWWYTGAQYPFPYLYDFTLNAFLYYYPDTAKPQHYTTAPRFFYNFTTSQIVTIPSALPAPAVGYLGPASGGALAGIMNNVSSGVTLVGISAAQPRGGSSTTVPVASVTVGYGATILSARRAPQQAAEDNRPHGVPEMAVDGPAEYRALTGGLRRMTSTGTVPQARRTRSLGVTVGATNPFWVANGAIGSIGNSAIQRPSTLKAVTAHGYIWVDDTLTVLDPTAIQAIANDFENAYASDTAHYGSSSYTTSSPGLAGYTLPTCDTTGARDGGIVPYFITPTDNKIDVLVIDVANLGSGVGGYFSPANYFYQGALNCNIGHGYTAASVAKSNEAPMFVVGYYTPNPDYFETGEDLVRGTAHEFQHLINFVNHAILNDGSYEDAWINEGMSMLAQDFAVRRMFPNTAIDVDDAGYRAGQYLAAPQNFSLTAFTGIVGGAQQYNCSGCYGEEYLFQRYLYDRFGGDAYLHKMLGLPLSYANLQQATGIDPAQAISDFAVAIGASGTNATTDPRFGFTGISLRDTYADQWGNQRNFLGPATVPLAAGTGAHMLGSFFYLNGDATAAGKTVTVKDLTGAYSLRAAVVQR